MGHWSCDTGSPAILIGAEELLRAVGIGDFDYTSESTLLTQHALMSTGCDNLVGPPARRDLHGERVLLGSLCAQQVRDVVGVCPLGLQWVGEAGLQHFATHRLSVHVEFVDTQGGGHPLGRRHLLFILHGRHQPAGTIGGPAVLVVVNLVGDDGCIGCRQPL